MKMFIGIIALCLSLNSIEGLTPFPECDEVISPYVRGAEQRGLILVVAGGGGINEVREVDLGFDTHGPVSISEARRILIREVTELINRLNAHRAIRPLMHQYPLTSENIFYCIDFIDRATNQPCLKGVQTIVCREGKIGYFDFDKRTRKGSNKPMFVETWEEAVALAKQPESKRA